MSKNKIILGNIFLLLLVAACGSVHKIAVPKPVENSLDLPSKKMLLTEKQKKNWSHKDLEKDTVPGMSIQKAYDFLKGKKNKNVLVAVLDSGIDLKHEDLEKTIWKNPKEIPNNQKDDDGNGFVDDVNGWNFLGEIYHENMEITRLIKKYQKQFAKLSETQKKAHPEYEKYQKIKAKYDKEKANKGMQKKQYQAIFMQYQKANDFLEKNTGKKNYTKEDVEKIKPSENRKYKMSIGIFNMTQEYKTSIKKQILALSEHLKTLKNYGYDLNFNPRKEILKDDENDFSITIYGNNLPKNYGNDEIHGTHVAGIIAAKHNNKKGINGVAKNVKFIAVRVVPDGDEYDKDIANGIIYAVNNGAKIINMSFGKGYSPYKKKVFEAIKYAAKKDVLIVHAAGNDAKNVDVEKFYPNDSEDLQTEISDNVLTVGAIRYSYDENMIAPFSNYGKKNVDIFAPGEEIYAPIPNNKYTYLSGTSMAAPAAAGVAAILRSYFPELSAKQIKHILMNSGTKIPFKLKKPGSAEKVYLDEISVSGRILNAYNAVKMAAKMLKK